MKSTVRATFMSRSGAEYMDCRTQASLLNSCSKNNYKSIATSRAKLRQVFRNTSGVLSRFFLVVDDFCLKYVGKEHADHLIAVLKQGYDLNEDWDGTKY